MIEERYNNATLIDGTQYTEFNYESKHLFIERGLPYYFSLTMGYEKAVRDVRVWSNDDLSGAKALVETIKAYAISGEEQWTPEQIAKVDGTQTIFIVYNNEHSMGLYYSKSIISLEDLEMQFLEAEKVFISYDISDLGLIALVDELLNWME